MEGCTTESSLTKLLGTGRALYVGRGTSRGQGRVNVAVSAAGSDSVEGLVHRLENLNRLAGERFPVLRDYTVFTCTLLSSTILLDEWLMTKSALDISDIAPGLERFNLLVRMTRCTTVSGWHSKAQLPKPDTIALAAGSCFLFAHKKGISEGEPDIGKLASVLADAEQHGLGERREEGFGEVSFCMPFHYDNGEDA